MGINSFSFQEKSLAMRPQPSVLRTTTAAAAYGAE